MEHLAAESFEDRRESSAIAQASRLIEETRRQNLLGLDLSNLGLPRLGDRIGLLVKLEKLGLSRNSLIQLPEAVSQLTKLQELFLPFNKLTELPEHIGLLRQLNQLDVSNNQLIRLPESVGELANLKRLNLAGNQLTHLPDAISGLRNLEELDLSGNQLTHLPAGLGNLKNLKQIYLHGNPALNIPPEELGTKSNAAPGRGIQKQASGVLDYYYKTRDLTKRPLNEAKLVFVGRGGVGKTSLRKRLLAGEWDRDEDKTPGIAVTPWFLTLGQEQIKLNVWDFGGQEIMHATHQLFLSKRSLYMLVLNAREGEQDANVEYWLRLIGGYGGGSPAIVVINKCHQYPLLLDQRGLIAKYPFIRGFCYTDCETEEGLAELRQRIERETTELPYLKTLFPEVWFELKRKLAELPCDCITFDEYRELCRLEREPNAGNQELLISFLHDLGTVLHFRDDIRLNHLGVLKPEWVTDGIYTLLNSDELKAAGGVLRDSQLTELLNPERYPVERHGFLIQLMEKFELCFEMTGMKRTEFLIPELLPKETPLIDEWKDGDSLGFEYHYNILPEGILPRFIVRTHALSEGQMRWRSGVVLRKGETLKQGDSVRTVEATALVRADVLERLVTIVVRGPGRQKRDLLAEVRGHFEEIHRGIAGLVADEQVPVPNYPQVKLDYRRLLVREANGKTFVEFETETDSVEMSLSRLLDNFEDWSLRSQRAQIIVQAGGRVYMPNEHNEQNIRVGRDLTGIVGLTLTRVEQWINRTERDDLREPLGELRSHVEKAAKSVGKEEGERMARDLEDFTKEATDTHPRKEYLAITSKGLIEAATTVGAIAAPIVETVNRIRTLIGF